MRKAMRWWDRVVGNPSLMRRANGYLTIIWILMIPISIATGWINSVTYVAALSLWALVGAHLSAWTAGRTEEKQDAAEERVKEGRPRLRSSNAPRRFPHRRRWVNYPHR